MSGTTPSLDEELDNILVNFGQVLQRNSPERAEVIRTCYRSAKTAITALIEQQVLAARIEELEGVQLEYSHYVATTYISGKAMPVKDRCHQLATLKAQDAKK